MALVVGRGQGWPAPVDGALRAHPAGPFLLGRCANLHSHQEIGGAALPMWVRRFFGFVAGCKVGGYVVWRVAVLQIQFLNVLFKRNEKKKKNLSETVKWLHCCSLFKLCSKLLTVFWFFSFFKNRYIFEFSAFKVFYHRFYIPMKFFNFCKISRFFRFF